MCGRQDKCWEHSNGSRALGSGRPGLGCQEEGETGAGKGEGKCVCRNQESPMQMTVTPSCWALALAQQGQDTREGAALSGTPTLSSFPA